MQDKHYMNMNKASELGLYIHVPFCASRCDYCAFYKTLPNKKDFQIYLDALKIELDSYKKISPDTIFIGGGSPSVLTESHLEKLCEILEEVKNVREFTVEVAPSSVSKKKLELFKQMGVNRISIGAQSFDENILKILGRTQSLKILYKALDEIAEANFKEFNIDLIFAIKNQTLKIFENDINIATNYPITHMSAYCIEYESGTALCAGNQNQDDNEFDEHEKREIEFVKFARQKISSKEFRPYEISNFAKEGHECAHNLGAWNMNNWIGIGPSAASQYNNMRYKNTASLNDWAKGVFENNFAREDIISLDNEELFLSGIIFGLRMSSGIDLKKLKERFSIKNPEKYADVIKNFCDENLMKKNSDRIFLTENGMLLADAIAAQFC